MDRHELDSAEFSVDSSHQFIYNSSQVLIFFNVLSARYCHLDQDNLANPFGMVGQEHFESM